MAAYPPHHVTLPHVTRANWRELAAQKKQDTLEKLPKEWRLPAGKYDDLVNVMHVPEECGILDALDLEITAVDDAKILAELIARRKYTAVQVATAYCKRAAIAHQLTNCLTEVLFDMAMQRAKQLDDHLEKTGKPLGPLHGVPVSLKDQFDIQGVELTMGYGGYLGRISPVNASLVNLLLASGAVLYVRTNVPQTLMMGDTFNHVFGRTHNPWNRAMSPGGSSGGESALLALKGSVMGVGTDIGGSVRMPSAFCGLYTIRPSSRRVPYGNATNSMLGQESILSVAGPMCRNMESVEYFMRTVLDVNPANFDASALPFPFDDRLYRKSSDFQKLAFGYFTWDGHVTPTSAMTRAIRETVEKLKAAGHDVFKFDMLQFKRLWGLVIDIFGAVRRFWGGASKEKLNMTIQDGGRDIRQVIEGIEEPLIPGLALGGPEDEKTVYELHQLNREKESIQQAVLANWMATVSQTSTGRPMDALIFPSAPHPAPPAGGARHPGYTAMFNALDLPVCVLPVTKVDPKRDIKKQGQEWLNETDEFIHGNYDPEQSAGLPVGIQVVGRRWQEEALLAITQKVVEAVKYS